MLPILKGKDNQHMPTLMFEMLEFSDEDFKTTIITMLSAVKENTLVMN